MLVGTPEWIFKSLLSKIRLPSCLALSNGRHGTALSLLRSLGHCIFFIYEQLGIAKDFLASLFRHPLIRLDNSSFTFYTKIGFRRIPFQLFCLNEI